MEYSELIQKNDVTLSVASLQFSFAYFEEFLTFSCIVKEQFYHIEPASTRGQDARATRKFESCNIATKTIDFLSNVFRPGRL